jgi:hypothetical protein
LAPGIRALLKHYEPSQRREAIQDLLGKDAQLRITRLDVKNLEQTSEPLVVTLEYEVDAAFHALDLPGAQKSLVGRLPCPWEIRYLQTDDAQARHTPFEIAVPIVIRSQVTVHSPPGMSLAGLDRRVGSEQTKFVDWQCQCSGSGDVVNMQYELRLPAGQHAPQDYEQYCATRKKTRLALQSPVTLRESTMETARRPAAAKAQ